jgi:hypothetical protein
MRRFATSPECFFEKYSGLYPSGTDLWPIKWTQYLINAYRTSAESICFVGKRLSDDLILVFVNYVTHPVGFQHPH